MTTTIYKRRQIEKELVSLRNDDQALASATHVLHTRFGVKSKKLIKARKEITKLITSLDAERQALKELEPDANGDPVQGTLFTCPLAEFKRLRVLRVSEREAVERIGKSVWFVDGKPVHVGRVYENPGVSPDRIRCATPKGRQPRPYPLRHAEGEPRRRGATPKGSPDRIRCATPKGSQ